MSSTAKIQYDGKSIELPVVQGTEDEKGIDISKLRAQTGLITMDPGYANTGACQSSITFIDGEKGILRYRGIPIEELAGSSTFVETSYLLIYGKLPKADELKRFSTLLTRHSMIHEDMKRFFDGYPMTAHPMAILSSMVCSLSSFYPDSLSPDQDQGVIDIMIARLLSKLRTIAAFSYKKSIGHPFIYPRNDLSYCANFLNMMFAVPAEPYEIHEELVKVVNLLLILHADHEQNCSTSTVRLVGSSQANLFASISAGICALWGPLHGGANQAVMKMLQLVRDEEGGAENYFAAVKDNKTTTRLMGFGHRVYKNYDPRARILQEACRRVTDVVKVDDSLLEVALRLEEIALSDEYFIKRKLYPNVDFYSGLIYRAMGIPEGMYTVMFALGRLPGWIAQWKELREDPTFRIGRPRQIYTGETKRPYTPIEQRT